MLKKQTILILTSGGLAPALNPTLYGIIKQARKYDYKILGGVDGWSCLLEKNKIIDLSKLDIEVLKARGGTLLRTSRTNPFSFVDGLEKIKNTLKNYKIDAIIAIGGDDTLRTANKLAKQGIKIIGLPKTIDNDLSNTFFTPGFPSAAYYTARLVDEVREDAAYAYGRIFIIEIMGNKAGWLTCSSVIGGADIIIPPEWKFENKKILDLIKKKYKENGFCVIAISKEAKISGLKSYNDKQTDGFNTKRNELISLALQNIIQDKLGYNTKIIIPMNTLQTGAPIYLDIKIGNEIGKQGSKLIKDNKFGLGISIQYRNNKFFTKNIPLEKYAEKTRIMSKEYFDFKKMQPTNKLYY